MGSLSKLVPSGLLSSQGNYYYGDEVGGSHFYPLIGDGCGWGGVSFMLKNVYTIYKIQHNNRVDPMSG